MPDHGLTGPVSTASRSPGPDEQYRSTCGEVIRQAADICRACGVRQRDTSGCDVSDRKLIDAAPYLPKDDEFAARYLDD
jgi:hypothetical protein